MTTGRHPRIPPDLVETIDELEPVRSHADEDDWRPRTHPGPSDEAQVRAREADERGWEWSKQVLARLDAIERVAEAHARRWKLIRGVLTGIGGVALTALVAAFKLAYSSGSASGVASERDRNAREIEAVVRQLTIDVARISGELRSFNPVGSLRMYGPGRNPKDTEPDR